MKTAFGVIGFVLIVSVVSALAQFLTERSHLNRVGEEEVRAAGSKLVIGMPEQTAISVLASNRLEPNASILDYKQWTRVYGYTNATASGYSCGFRLVFRPKPGNEVMREGRLVQTNGMLHAALLNGVQIARTNAP